MCVCMYIYIHAIGVDLCHGAVGTSGCHRRLVQAVRARLGAQPPGKRSGKQTGRAGLLERDLAPEVCVRGLTVSSGNGKTNSTAHHGTGGHPEMRHTRGDVWEGGLPVVSPAWSFTPWRSVTKSCASFCAWPRGFEACMCASFATCVSSAAWLEASRRCRSMGLRSRAASRGAARRICLWGNIVLGRRVCMR